MTLRALLAALADALLGCHHRNLGVWFRRGGKDWQTCLQCGVAVLAKVQTGPDQFIKPPRLTAGLDEEWLAAREQLALGGQIAARKTGLERFADRQEPDMTPEELERLVRL